MERLREMGRHLNMSDVKKEVINVTVTGAAGNIGYALVFMIGQGRLLGSNQKINLTLLEMPAAK